MQAIMFFWEYKTLFLFGIQDFFFSKKKDCKRKKEKGQINFQGLPHLLKVFL